MISRIIKQYSKAFVDTLYPPKCPSCKAKVSDDLVFCESCWEEVEFISNPCCAKCSINLPASYLGLLCDRCETRKYSFDRNISAVRYKDSIKDIVHKLKFSDATQLAKIMAHNMTLAFNRFAHEQFDIIVPVPMHPKKLKMRKYNQAALIAKHVAEYTGIQICYDALIKLDDTMSQIAYSRLDRFLNMKTAFSFNDKLSVRSCNVLIIDDVMTTGATLNACAKVLKKHGANKVYCLTFARTF
ncbi:MAG: ComF family protein [Candidatus Jidaibacter sp.]|nr:ComF family protein [Candidatus Jidaibacter sp.]